MDLMDEFERRTIKIYYRRTAEQTFDLYHINYHAKVLHLVKSKLKNLKTKKMKWKLKMVKLKIKWKTMHLRR